jgi:hypothetical protein
VDDHHFPVDDRLPGNIEGAGNDRKPFRPVQPVAGVELPLSLVQVDLYPIAVELDFMEPLVARWRFGFKGGELGLDESGHLRFLGRRPTVHTLGHHFLKRKLTNKTAITKAAAMAVVPWAFTLSPQKLNSSLSMTQLSLKGF